MLLFILTGCWDAKELQNVNYVTAVGIDYSEGKYKVYVQVLDFSSIAKGDEPKSPEPVPLYIGESTGPTLIEAFNNLLKTSQRRINWGHVGAVIYSDAALKNGVEKIEQAMHRHGEYRYTPWMFGTQEPIEEIFGVTGFYRLPALYTILYRPRDLYKVRSYIKPIRMHKFVSIYQNPGGTAFIPSISVDKETWKEQVLKKNPKYTLKINGVYPVTRGKSKKRMTYEEVAGLRWVQPHTKDTPVKIVQNGKEKGSVDIINPSADIHQVMETGKPKFTIKVKAEGTLAGLAKNISSNKIEQLVEKQIKKEILTTYQHGINKNVDVYNLKSILFHNRMNSERLKDVQLTKDNLKKVSVHFHLESKGFYD